MGRSPLGHPRLLAIEHQLDAGNVDEAQHLLAHLDDDLSFGAATSYLSIRMLWLRGRLSHKDVAQRLRELLSTQDYFPEAAAMLRAAEANTLGRDARFKSQVPPQWNGAVPAPSAPAIEVGTLTLSLDPEADDGIDLEAEEHEIDALPPLGAGGPYVEVPDLEDPAIPRAGRAPRFTPPSNLAPSYVPKPPVPPTPDPPEARPASEPPRGRYSESPPRQEIVRRGSSRPPRNVGAPSAQQASERPAPAGRIRSGHPPPVTERGLPSLFEIAGLADAGRFDEALQALERAGPHKSAETVLLHTRLLMRVGREAEARDELAKLSVEPLLDPELRAGIARQLLELSATELALAQAELAFRDDAASPMVRLTLAWALLRMSRRRDRSALVRRSVELLDDLRPRSVSLPGLLSALRACVMAALGDPSKAVHQAQRALAEDSSYPDALIALALGSARVGRIRDAQRALERARSAAPAEAEVLERLLEGLGIGVNSAPTIEPTGPSPWNDAEQAAAAGRGREAAVVLEGRAKERLSALAPERATDLASLAAVAAGFLSTEPVVCDFGPWDRSLWSIARLDAALGLIYRTQGPELSRSDDYPLLLLTTAYLGDTLRRCHDLHWRGSLAEPRALVVCGDPLELAPFVLLERRVRRGERMLADPRLDPERADVTSEAWARFTESPLAAPTPWKGEWPTLEELGNIGAAMGRSVVSRWCEQHAEGPLDHTVASLAAVDSYVSLIAPARAPRSESPYLSRRAAVCVGAYVGEVMRLVAGGRWSHDPSVEGARSLRLELGPTVDAVPVEQVQLRLAGRLGPLADYAERLLARAQG